jgi:hypothetical protein
VREAVNGDKPILSYASPEAARRPSGSFKGVTQFVGLQLAVLAAYLILRALYDWLS